MPRRTEKRTWEEMLASRADGRPREATVAEHLRRKLPSAFCECLRGSSQAGTESNAFLASLAGGGE